MEPASNPTSSKKQNGCWKSLFGLGRTDPILMKKILSEYKYVAPNLSFFERLYLNQFWEYVVVLYPKWLAPNLITFSGFLCICFSMMLLMIYSPNCEGDCPLWWFALTSFTLFIYQTLDGSDGKQARRTKTGSPLGEMFDHGVDAMVMVTLLLYQAEATALGLGDNLQFICFFGGYLAFFYSIFTALHIGKQRFAFIDCQEAEVMFEIILLVTFLVGGPDFWENSIALPKAYVQYIPLWLYDWKSYGDSSISYRFLIPLITFPGVYKNIIAANISVLLHVLNNENKNPHKEGRGISSYICQQLTIALHCALGLASWFAVKDLRSSDSSVLVAFYLMYSFTFCDLVNHTLVTRVVQLPFPHIWKNRALISDSVFYILLLFGSSKWLIFARWAMVAFTFVCNMLYCITIGNAICDALQIRVFQIPYKPHSQ